MTSGANMVAPNDAKAASMPGGLPTSSASDHGSGSRRRTVVLAIRATLVLAAVGVAYHYSLLTLLRGLGMDTPLAYLGLVPMLAIALAVIAGRRWRWEPDIHDRYVDYIVGTPLIVGALIVMVVAPAMLSSFFWRWRLDLLTLPVFVAGAVTIVFGIRTTLRVKAAIAFLFLAWPLPYTLLLGGWLEATTEATIHALRGVVTILPVARPLDSADGSLFLIPYGAEGFRVSVASACAGVNGSLGFLLIGAAVINGVSGPMWRRLFWLANGVVVTIALNLVRIVAIFIAGGRWGPEFALDALHPVIGLVTFNLGVLLSVAALPLFGLRLRTAMPEKPPASDGEPRRALRPLPVQRAAVALCVVLAASALAGRADAGLRQFEPVAGDLGPPRIGEWSAALATLDGWSVRMTDTYPWVEQYFGRGSTWVRYAYLSAPASAAATATNRAAPTFVNVDVISTWDLGTLSAYGLEACYGFHNYRVLDTQRIDLGAGVVGHTLAYFDARSEGAWTALYWEWPVESGGHERYERIILNLPTAAARVPPTASAIGDPFSDLQLALASALGGPAPRSSDPELASVRAFLIGFAQELVAARASHLGEALPGSVS